MNNPSAAHLAFNFELDQVAARVLRYDSSTCQFGGTKIAIDPISSPSPTSSSAPDTRKAAKTPVRWLFVQGQGRRRKFELRLNYFREIQVVRWCCTWTIVGFRSESFRSATNAPSRDFREFTLESRTFWIGSTPTRSTTEEPCCFIPLDFCLIFSRFLFDFFLTKKL